jgi:hypothetical protein
MRSRAVSSAIDKSDPANADGTTTSGNTPQSGPMQTPQVPAMPTLTAAAAAPSAGTPNKAPKPDKADKGDGKGDKATVVAQEGGKVLVDPSAGPDVGDAAGSIDVSLLTSLTSGCNVSCCYFMFMFTCIIFFGVVIG